MSNQPTQAVAVKTGGKEMEFQPYGTADKIKLTIEIVKNIIAVPTRSGKTCSDRDAIKFMMMCQAKRLNPFEGDSFLVGYDGQTGPEFSLITAHQAFLKRAELHPEYDGMKSGIIIKKDDGSIVDVEGDFHEPEDNVVGGWATVFFKNRKYPCTRRVRMERFNKGFAQWKADAAGMICKCAEADALRSSFPTMLGGLYMREEIDASNFGINVLVDEVKRKPSLELFMSDAPRQQALPAPQAELTMTKPLPSEPVKEQAPRKQVPKAAPSAQAAIDEAVAARNPTPQDSLGMFLTNAGVEWDDFRGFLVSEGHYKDADSLATIDELPSSVCNDIIKNTAAMAKAVKLFGKQ